MTDGDVATVVVITVNVVVQAAAEMVVVETVPGYVAVTVFVLSWMSIKVEQNADAFIETKTS